MNQAEQQIGSMLSGPPNVKIRPDSLETSYEQLLKRSGARLPLRAIRSWLRRKSKNRSAHWFIEFPMSDRTRPSRVKGPKNWNECQHEDAENEREHSQPASPLTRFLN